MAEGANPYESEEYEDFVAQTEATRKGANEMTKYYTTATDARTGVATDYVHTDVYLARQMRRFFGRHGHYTVATVDMVKTLAD